MFIYAIAIFLSAALLFVIQPLTGKLLLPLLGGSPGVWNTCMVFFQAALLAGYLYSHLLSKVKSIVAQAGIHVAVVAATWLVLPIALSSTQPAEFSPTAWLLETLLKTVGLPFFCVATTGPLIQRWFSRTDHPRAADPYFLYSASNAGSVLGLLAYPFLIEPALTRVEQSRMWQLGFGMLAILLVFCAALTLRRAVASTQTNSTTDPTSPLTAARRACWVLWSFIPSSLMIGVTQSISTDIAPVPLLWILPLVLYLVSFIIAFANIRLASAENLGRVLPIVVIPIMALMLAGPNQASIVLIVAIHIVGFFIAATMCHRRIAEDRPSVSHLTEYYLWMSVGGVLGGVFNSLIAPLAFNAIVEYPIVLGLACLARPQTAADLTYWRNRLGPYAALLVLGSVLLALASLVSTLVIVADDEGTPTRPMLAGFLRMGVPCILAAGLLMWRGSVRFAAAITMLMIGSQYLRVGGPLLVQTRTFFGVHRVAMNPDATWCVLHHGTTMHGIQIKSEHVPAPPEGLPPTDAATRNRLFFEPRERFTKNQRIALSYLIPATYYHPTGPVGDLFTPIRENTDIRNCAFIGMGTGSLAAYGRPGMNIDFFEIDPEVVEIANNPELFSYIYHSLADQSRLQLGDGRINMSKMPDASYDVIVIDAFSSDAIPVHLITREALSIYLSKLRPGGVIAFHISNRYFDLRPVLARLAAIERVHAYLRTDNVLLLPDIAEGKKESDWVVVCNKPEDFAPFSELPLWQKLIDDPRYPTWTDDYSDVLSVFVGWKAP